MVKLVDTRDLKSLDWKRLCRFDSGSGHQDSVSVSLKVYHFRETASACFDRNSGEETAVDPSPNTTLPNPFIVTVPGNPSITEELYGTTGSEGVKSKAHRYLGAHRQMLL